MEGIAVKSYFICLLVICLSGCAPVLQLSPRISDNNTQDTIYVDGNEVIISEKEHTTIAAFGEAVKGELELTIHVMNISQERIDVLPENIIVTGKKANGDQISLDVIQPNEYLRKIENQNRASLVASAIVGLVNTVEAGRSTADISGNINTIPFNGTVETYNNYNQLAMGQMVTQNLTNMTVAQNLAYNAVDHSLLKKHTLFPTQQLLGVVKIDYKPATEYTFEITLGDDIHTVTFLPDEETANAQRYQNNSFSRINRSTGH